MLLRKDAERMEQIMERTANRCDIWQDRFIYWIAVAIYHIIIYIARVEMRKGQINETINLDSGSTDDSHKL